MKLNDNGIIRQYIAFAVVVLTAIFIVSQFEWYSLPVPDINPADSGFPVETTEQSGAIDPEINFRDLSVGGVTGASRRQKRETVFSPAEAVTQTTAATSSALTATSTPFQAGSGLESTYSGVNVQFSKLE